VLADALLAWYAELLGQALEGIARRAARLSPSALADAFVGLGDQPARRSSWQARTEAPIRRVLVVDPAPVNPRALRRPRDCQRWEGRCLRRDPQHIFWRGGDE
jgi:hypothetical protein